MLRQDNLILYKSQPGRITQLNRKKIDIRLADGQTLSVRPKDVTFLHPGPLHSLRDLTPQQGEIKTAWELLAGTTTNLEELADLAYGAFTPATAWAVWQLVEDGLYFSGTPDEIEVHTAEDVADEQASRAAKAAEVRAWEAFVERIEADAYVPEDTQYLVEIEALARRQSDTSRVMRALGRSETPQNAHALLLAVGYWDTHINPYPHSLDIILTPPMYATPDLPEEARRDLTHLTAVAIDDEGTQDPDDALSWEDGRLWVHIADVGALVPPDSEADLEARARGANLYLPEGTVPMLPPAVTDTLALGLTEVSPALSFSLEVDAAGQPRAVEIVPSWVRVTRLTYAEADAQLETAPLLGEMYALARRYYARRQTNGAIEIDLPEVKVSVAEGVVEIRPLPNLRSRTLVREAMLMTGEAVGRFALENEIPLPFTAQDGPNEADRASVPAETPAANFALRRLMRRSQQQNAPGPHAGLGMDIYVQATSPLRRYLDLVVHQQLRAYLRGERVLDGSAVMERVGAANAVTGDMRRAERLSITHWQFVYLLQHPKWEGEGVIIEKRGARDVILIPELGIETQVYASRPTEIDECVKLRLERVNLPELDASFTLV